MKKMLSKKRGVLSQSVVLDYRGKRSHGVFNDLRELVLNKRADVDEVNVLVDTERFARKIELYAAITKRRYNVEKKDDHWSVVVVRPACEVTDGVCSCSV